MLFDVTGRAKKWCVPCAMSAATGLPTDQWDDEPWSIDGADPMIHISSALERVWSESARRWTRWIDELPWDSPLIGQPLSSFPLPGRWVVQVDMDGRTDLVTDTHCVALGVEQVPERALAPVPRGTTLSAVRCRWPG